MNMQALAGIAVFITACVALLAPVAGGRTELSRALQDAAHAPLFALVAVTAFKYLQHRTNPLAAYRQAFAIALSLGAAGELAQLLLTTTRQAEFKDLVNDACGALAALCWLARRNRRIQPSTRQKHQLLATASLACIVVTAPVAWTGSFYIQRWAQAPELLTWGSDSGYHFLQPTGTQNQVVRLPAPWHTRSDEWALHVSPDSNHRWAGITLTELLPDWRGYSYLAIEIVNPNDTALQLNLRIDDRQHHQEYHDRFNRSLMIAARTRSTISVPLEDMAQAPATRSLDLGHIAQLILFQDTQNGAHTFYLCSLRLIRERA